MTFKHPPTPPAIPTDAVLTTVHRRVVHTLSAYYEDVAGARQAAEEGVLQRLADSLRVRYGPAVVEEVRRRHYYVHRPPAWPGDMARVWVTVELPDRDAAQ